MQQPEQTQHCPGMCAREGRCIQYTALRFMKLFSRKGHEAPQILKKRCWLVEWLMKGLLVSSSGSYVEKVAILSGRDVCIDPITGLCEGGGCCDHEPGVHCIGYIDAARCFNTILAYINRTKQYHVRSVQYDQVGAQEWLLVKLSGTPTWQSALTGSQHDMSARRFGCLLPDCPARFLS
eukprot:1158771-Pelagomonas_calceolata.AAC.6